MIRNSRSLLRWKLPASSSTLTRAHASSLASSPPRAKLALAHDARRGALPLVQRAFYAKSPYDKIDVEAEKKLAKEKLESRPEEVTTDSSTRKVWEPSPNPGKQASVNDGLKHDVGIVKDTFKMDDVPKEPWVLGLAGTLPYLGTSLSTVYLTWAINSSTSASALSSIRLSESDAHHLLALLEPVQLGYGAIIISFLGAVHWGMEYTAKEPSVSRSRFRYGIGVAAPMVAWPTLLMPIEAALTSQFLAFTLMYLADARASTHGWAPYWYSRYRFILTAIVGVAIAVSLIGRAKVGSAAPRLGQGLSDRVHKDLADKKTDWVTLEAEEREKNRKKAEEEKKKLEKAEAEEKKKNKSKSKGEGKDSKEADAQKGDSASKKDKSEEEKKPKDDGKEKTQADDKEDGADGKEDETKDDKSSEKDDGKKE